MATLKVAFDEQKQSFIGKVVNLYLLMQYKPAGRALHNRIAKKETCNDMFMGLLESPWRSVRIAPAI